MKNKLGFNLIFAIIAFPIGLGLLRELNFDTLKFKNPALGVLYLITLIACIVLMLRKKENKPD